MSESPLLEVRQLHVRYGPAEALFGVDLKVNAGETVAVLGPNGAGKSTLGRAICGLVPSWQGSLAFDGKDITRLPAHKVRALGLVYIPEERGIFAGLSVVDNLRMAVGGIPRVNRADAINRAIERFPVLGSRRTQRAGSLSGGEQQMLALARVLAVEPKLIIADELSLGLAPLIVQSVFEHLQMVKDRGTSIVLIEQFVHRALDLADTCVILNRGRVRWNGDADGAGPEVLDRYLGEAEEKAEST
jgi:branched-chain amino acid transport system ATP-binding protein